MKVVKRFVGTQAIAAGQCLKRCAEAEKRDMRERRKEDVL